MKWKMPNFSCGGAKDHLFEADTCSGILVFTIDRCEPVQLKFSQKIRVEVNFDGLSSTPEKFPADTQNNSEGVLESCSQPQRNILPDKAESSSRIQGDCLNSLSPNKSGSNGYMINDCTPYAVIHPEERCDNSGSRQVGNSITIKSSQFEGGDHHENEVDSDKDSNGSNYGVEFKGSVTNLREQYSNSIVHSERTLRKRGRKTALSTDVQIDKDKTESGIIPSEYSNSTQDDHSIHRLRSSSRLKSDSKKAKMTHALRKQKKTETFSAMFITGNKINSKRKENTEKRGIQSVKNFMNKTPHEKCRKMSELGKTRAIANKLKSENSANIVHEDQERVDDTLQEDAQREEFISASSSDDESLVSFKEEDNSTDESIDHKPVPKKSKPRNRKRKLLLEKDVKCTYCGVTFDTKLDFFNHRREKGSIYTCKICGKTEPFEGFLMVHMQTHKPHKGHLPEDDANDDNSSEKVLKKKFKMKCDVCGLVVSSLDSLKTHTMNHTGEFPYKCCVCDDQRFCSLSSLHYHLESHKSAERILCKLCNVRFASRAELAKHRLTHDITCALCGEHFPNKTSRNCHYRTVHPNDVLKCSLCFRLFATEADYQNHLLYHRKRKKAQCPECGVVVVKLKDHMTVHSKKDEDKMFACEQCSLKFKYKSTLDKHLLTHTGERPYACNKCVKRFRSNGELRKHLLTHTLERHFVCEVCGKRCALRSNLAMHMRTHSDTRQYSCNFCTQSFNYKNSLQIHIKAKHANQTQSSFICPHCAQTFQDNALLTSHILTQHSEAKVCDDRVKSVPQAASSNQQQNFSQMTSQVEAPSLSSFIPDQLQVQAYQSNMDHNQHNSLHMTNRNNTLEMQSLETAPTLLPTPTSSYNTNTCVPMTASGQEPMVRGGEMLSYLSRDCISPMGPPPSILPAPPALHLLPPLRMDLQHSNSFNSNNSNINSLPPVHTLPPHNSGLAEGSSAPISIRGLQDSSSFDDQVQYSVYHKL